MSVAVRVVLTAGLFYLVGRHGVSVRGGAPGFASVWAAGEVAVAADRLLRRRRASRAWKRGPVMFDPFDWRRN